MFRIIERRYESIRDTDEGIWHECSFIRVERRDQFRSNGRVKRDVQRPTFDPYSEQTKEGKALLDRNQNLVRWYSPLKDSASWKTQRILITVATALVLSVGAYSAADMDLNSPLIAFLMALGIFAVILLIASSGIRTALLGLIHSNHELVTRLKTYRNMRFYFWGDKKDILFIETERKLIGLGFFWVKDIPESIQANFKRFERTLYNARIPLYWVYNHAAFTEEMADGGATGKNGNEEEGEDVQVLFGTRQTVSALFNIESKRAELYEKVAAYLDSLKSAFINAYPHTEIQPLQDQQLVEAYRTIIRGGAMCVSI